MHKLVLLGNFFRIRSAFKFGARKLGRILLLPKERIADEIKRFFANTLERHGHKSGKSLSPSHSRIFSEEKIQLKSLNLDLDNNIPGVSDNEVDRYSTKDDSVQMAGSVDGNGVLVSDLAGEVSLRIENDTSDCSLSSCKSSSSLSGLNYHSPSFYSSLSSMENGKLNGKKPENAIDERMGFNLRMEHRESHIGAGNAVCSCCNNHEGVSSTGSEILSLDASISGGLGLDFKERDLGDIPGNLETLNPFSDLSGDYDSHIRSLLYGQCCHGYALSAPVPPNPPTFPSILPKEKPWDTVHRPVPLKQNACPQMNMNGVVLGPMQTPTNNPTPSNYAFCSSERHKPQGTGTYIPNTIISDLTHGILQNGVSCRERSSRGRGRSQATGNHRQFQRHNRNNNGSAPAPPEKKLSDEGSHELRSPVLRRWMSGLSQQSTQSVLDNSQAAGVPVSAQKLEFGSLRHLPIESSEPASDTSHGCSSAPSLGELENQSSKSIVGNNEGR